MAHYLETAGVVLVALAGVVVGSILSRMGKRWWVAGYGGAWVLVLAAGIARRWWYLGLTFPFSLLMAGRREFALMAFACPLLFWSVFQRLPLKVEKFLVCLFSAWVVCTFCLIPFLQPVLAEKELSEIETRFTDDGICLQNTAYTCGPAAAVTALRRLEIRADEGGIAVNAYSNSRWGTETDSLCLALEKMYGVQGLTCEYRTFASINDLKNAEGIPIVLVKFAYMVDHYVVVLTVTEKEVVLGDPLDGRRVLTHDEFKKIWRGYGIVLQRKMKGQVSLLA